MSRLTLISSLALSIVVAGCVDRAAQQQAKATEKLVSNPTRSVTVQPARTQDISESLEITGSVTTANDTEAGVKNAGKIAAVYVKDGDAVVVGQLIAMQDTATLQAQLRSALGSAANARSGLSQAKANAAIQPSKTAAAVASAQAALRSAQASLKKARAGARPEERTQAEWTVRSAKSNLDTARQELERNQMLYKEGAVPKRNLDQAQSAYDAALTQYNAALQGQLMLGTRPEDLQVAQEAVRQAQDQLRSAQAQQKLDVLLNDQVQSANAQLESALAQVDIARQALKDAEVRAPFSGKISGRPVQPGTALGSGTAVARIIGAQGAYFEGQVPETVVNHINTGSRVSVTLDALPGRTFAGTVAAVSPLAQEVGRLFAVRIQLSIDNSGIRPGMFATGRIQLRAIHNAVVVPANAVVTRDNATFVFIAGGVKAKKVPVTVGLRQSDVVQVSGVSAGDRIIVQGQDALEDGSAIEAHDAKAAMKADLKGNGA